MIKLMSMLLLMKVSFLRYNILGVKNMHFNQLYNSLTIIGHNVQLVNKIIMINYYYDYCYKIIVAIVLPFKKHVYLN